MTDQDIHSIGIDIVMRALAKDGYEILTKNYDPQLDPQILIKKSGKMAYVLVRTCPHPNTPEVAADVLQAICEHAELNEAVPYFAGVSLANAAHLGNETLYKPTDEAGFLVHYGGLKRIRKMSFEELIARH